MGQLDVDRMLASIPAAQLSEWMAFDSLEPISLGLRGDLQTGILASLMANIHRDPRRKPDPYEAGDFMPNFEPSHQKPQSADDIYDVFRNWALLSGAKPNKPQ